MHDDYGCMIIADVCANFRTLNIHESKLKTSHENAVKKGVQNILHTILAIISLRLAANASDMGAPKISKVNMTYRC